MDGGTPGYGFQPSYQQCRLSVWALESLPEAWQEEHALIGIHLHFRKESHAGEQMKSLLFRQENLTCHHIMQGDELRAEAVLEWDV